MKFDDSQKYCHQLGGYLAAPQSKPQNDLLKEFMNKKNLVSAWLGIRQKEGEGRYAYFFDQRS